MDEQEPMNDEEARNDEDDEIPEEIPKLGTTRKKRGSNRPPCSLHQINAGCQRRENKDGHHSPCVL